MTLFLILSMNFLGHLYFSDNDLALMQANIFGDFVKGKDLSRFPIKMQEGILLHRKIDSYIDTHPSVILLLHRLYSDLPKVAGIAVDLYFDHLLAKNWKDFHTKDLDVFINQFYASIDTSNENYSSQYFYMLEKMQEKNWLFQYQFLDGLDKSCHGVSRRISFENKLSIGVDVFKKFEKEIEYAFFEYMKDAKIVFKS